MKTCNCPNLIRFFVPWCSCHLKVIRRVPTVEQDILTHFFPWDICGFRVAQSHVFCVARCRSLLILLSYFYWSLYCISSFDLQLLVTRGGSRSAPLKLEKIRFFAVKSWFITRNTQTIFAPPSARCNVFKCATL